MPSIRLAATFLAGSALFFAGAATPAGAQPTDSASAPSAKQLQKEQKKADRKARRAKKNAELSELEKNGYQPAGNQVDYPNNYQNAQRKADAQKAAKPAATSAP
ncbi:hypothetical protein [Caballeronia sp. J97]|uniref:hypothetical protein n=1 Tax=Caballeronia sp. J97 TaxID=2805429 RepID=UPI002AB08024|nr:hypothetical protein [Caballeronia sp. J97]